MFTPEVRDRLRDDRCNAEDPTIASGAAELNVIGELLKVVNTHSGSREVENTIPILPVRDVQRSIDFYTAVLAFKLDWGGAADRIASVSRDGCSIMLRQDDVFTKPSWVWIGLESDALFDELRAKGVTVVQEPRNCSWAYEMKVADPDGNVVWLGTEPRSDVPFADADSTIE